MKKLITVCILILAVFLPSVGANVFNPNIMYRFDAENEDFRMALDKNMNLHFTLIERSDNSVAISIFGNKGFDIEKTICIPFDPEDIRDFGLYNNSGLNNCEVWLTQNLFNTDDKWEYMIYDYETETMKVYNEDSEYLGSIQNGLNLDAIFIIGENACFFGYDDYDDGDLLCSFTSKGNSMKEIKLDESKSVITYPNPIRSSENFIIELNSPLPENGKLKIMNTSGRVIFSKNVTAGENIIIVPSIRLRKGMYVYVIESRGNIIGTDKIIVD